MYPFRFEPLFQRYLWGGRRLADVLQKPIGDQSAAESWEVVDHQDNQSVVRDGPLAGKSLRHLIAEYGADLVGDHVMATISSNDVPTHLRNRFPLLLKFLDANRNLSVQVHPDDQLGATLSPPDLGKTEAWYVMHADPGTKIYAGLKPGVTQESFQAAIESDTVESTLHSFEPKQGDCVFIKAGTMHAIGAGLLIAEIQQASNTTFRVYDWGRVDAEGNPRPLHLQQSIQATDFSLGPVSPENPDPITDSQWQTIVECEKFAMRRGNFTDTVTVKLDRKFRIFAVTSGSAQISDDPCQSPLQLGETVLVPACLDTIELTPGPNGVELLEIFVPD